MPGKAPVKHVKGKRFRSGVVHAADDGGVEVEMTEAVHFSRSAYTFDMDLPSEWVRMIRKMWTGEYRGAVGVQADANPALAELLRQLTRTDYKDRQYDSEEHSFGQSLRLEGVLSDICRWQSQKQMPLWTALNAVEARRYQCSEPLWDCLRQMHPGLLPTINWTDTLIEDAVPHNPGCPYDAISGVAGVIFDNYQRQCKYKAMATTESAGYRLDMTNWGKFTIPRALLPPGFDPLPICALLPRTCALACRLLTPSPFAQSVSPFGKTGRLELSLAPFWSPTSKFCETRRAALPRACVRRRRARSSIGPIVTPAGSRTSSMAIQCSASCNQSWRTSSTR